MLPGGKTAPEIGPKRVTLKVLAEYLNLSPTTVSVVLTNSPLAHTIAKPTQDRIWEAVRKFQYRPNLFARYLHTKRTFIIAVLVPDIGVTVLDHDLPTAGNFHAAETADIVGGVGRRTRVAPGRG